MRLSSLCVTALLLLSSATFAQHASSGSSGSSASSSSSGGSSHSSSSAPSSSSSRSFSGGHSASPSGGSANSHSSGGSVSHGSNAHVTGGAVAHASSPRGSSSAATSPHFDLRESKSNSNANATRSIREPSTGLRTTSPQPEKRTFFSFLRHPFRRPQPTPEPTAVAKLRHRVCLSGPCMACPAGQARIGGGCGAAAGGTYTHTHTFCPAGEIWSGGACLLQVRFMDDCSSLRRLMERQAQSMQAAQSARQGACSGGTTQECSALDSTAQSESGLYKALQERYRQCLQRSRTAYTFSGFPFNAYSTGLMFEPFGID